MKNFLVATDLSARSDRAVLRAVKLAREFKAKLTIIHTIDSEIPRGIIDESEKFARQEIEYCLKGKIKNIKCDIKIVVGNAHKEILKISIKDKVDLIILGIHRHTNRDDPIVGNVIERVVKNSATPVLVVKDRAEMDYKDILVGVDFNAYSKKSLKTALEFFESSTFHILHSYQIPFLGIVGNNADLEKQIVQTSQNDLNEMVEEAVMHCSSGKKKSFKINQLVKKGYILDALKEELTYLRPQLLVLGTHGRTGISNIMVISVTEHILSNPTCDVLVTN
jgi:nucleotide-binding universal stress UspA family protein